MLLSIIISTKYTEPILLRKTLESIVGAELLEGEVIVVDQNEDRRMEDLVREFGMTYQAISWHYLSSLESGLSKGRNQGYKNSHGDWIVFFDDDVCLRPGIINACAETLKQNRGKTCIYYGQVLNLEDNTPYLTRSFIAMERLSFFNFDTVCSIGLLFNRKVVVEIGAFDERFGVGGEYGAGEEADMILRSLERNIPIIRLESFSVYHPKAAHTTDKVYSYGVGLGALYRKHLTMPFRKYLSIGVKFLFEIILRGCAMLAFFLCLQPDKAKYHLRYVRGFLYGFKVYRSL